ncbi:14258_t:CDS:2, partial [Funneliformis caledonium]
MAIPAHEAVITLLQGYFKVPNGGIFINLPINVLGQPYHYELSYNTSTLKVAADVTICPDSQKISLWNIKCENWMIQQCVRIRTWYKERKGTEQMIAVPPTGPVATPVARLSGRFVQE